MYSVTMLLLLFIEIKPFSWQVTLSKKLIHLTLLFKWKFFRHRWSNQYLTPWPQQSFPRIPMALVIFWIWIFVRNIIASTLNNDSIRCIISKRRDNVMITLFYRCSRKSSYSYLYVLHVLLNVLCTFNLRPVSTGILVPTVKVLRPYTFFYKQLFYKSLALSLKIAKQLWVLNHLAISNNMKLQITENRLVKDFVKSVKNIYFWILFLPKVFSTTV